MNEHFEFAFHTVKEGSASLAEVDGTLTLLGSQGWQIRGLTALKGGDVLVALQRSRSAESELPDSPSLHAALAEPLVAPTSEDLSP